MTPKTLCAQRVSTHTKDPLCYVKNPATPETLCYVLTSLAIPKILYATQRIRPRQKLSMLCPYVFGHTQDPVCYVQNPATPKTLCYVLTSLAIPKSLYATHGIWTHQKLYATSLRLWPYQRSFMLRKESGHTKNSMVRLTSLAIPKSLCATCRIRPCP